MDKQQQGTNNFTTMLSHLGALVGLRSAQPACGLFVPAAQQLLGHVHIAGFATKTKPSPPYLRDIKKGSSKKSKAEEEEKKVPRALTAYTWYVKEQATARKGEASSATDLMKLIARDWKGLSDQQKKPYNDLAAKSKAEAAAARGEVKTNKAPPSAYIQWHQEVFREVKASNPSMKATDITKEVAVRWHALPQAEKDRRSAAAKAAKEDWKAQQPVVVQ